MRVNPVVEKERVIYNRIETFERLYDVSYPVWEYERRVGRRVRDKYLNLSIDRGYEHYRITNVGEMGKAGILTSFYKNMREFMNKEGEFLVIFNMISGKPVSLVIRDIGGKTVLDHVLYSCFYGVDLLKENFRFGDYIVITEGVYDADVFRVIYGNTIAMLTSSVSSMQAEMLSTITKRFIIAFDNDGAGERGTETAIKNLKKVRDSNEVEVLKVYNEDKDLGEMEEKKDLMGAYESRKTYYESSLRILTGGGDISE